MSEFKGTKGKWSSYQVGNGDIHVSAKGFRDLAIVNFYPEGFRDKYINGKITGSPAPNSNEFRRECIYNAKVIACAPEMLEMLIKIERYCAENQGQIGEPYFVTELDELIKKATL